ncbi:histone-fold-containing protein [Melanomma pulvis-pyrius CBS 109.77]|uniref:Histone H4 n=1 Tax=Melanomma pulvis-pyrius CBS 109.77 TaxID=1314802 RepID=A0A6A6XIN3_9PLEO|nr:histone-fold-containing protein [Melanomma pulvis-pyrius CBS 109.77]
MVNERPRGYLGELSGGFPGVKRAGPPGSSAESPSAAKAQRLNTTGHGGKGLGKGKGKAQRRHQKILRDNINGVTKGDIRRIARRGGVKRISAAAYPEVRIALKQRLEGILKQCAAVVEHNGRKTVYVQDVIYVLNRTGNPVYGFDPAFSHH